MHQISIDVVQSEIANVIPLDLSIVFLSIPIYTFFDV